MCGDPACSQASIHMNRLRKFNIRPFHWLLILAVGISIGISLAHFLVPHHYLAIHGFLRRTYYVPVILTGLALRIQANDISCRLHCGRILAVRPASMAQSPTAVKSGRNL